MHSIRIHGRGGQGAVTTGQILATAAFEDGLESLTFPKFGVERAGAPVESYVRIDKHPIHNRSQIYHPDIVLVLDPSLLRVKSAGVQQGVPNGGIFIVNTNKPRKQLSIPSQYSVYCVDATSIAMDIFKRPIVNTPILGAFSAITRIVSLQSLKKAAHDRMASAKGEHIADLNRQAVEKVYNLVK